MTNWTDIHSDFTPRLQELWERREYSWEAPKFTAEQVQKWIDKGLLPTDYDLANYLNKWRNILKKNSNLTQLRKKYAQNLDWRNIHKNFVAKELIFSNKTYQEKWMEANLTYAEAKFLIEVGLSPSDYNIATYLKKDGYNLIGSATVNLAEAKVKTTWQDICPKFDYYYRKKWEQRNFNKERSEEWIKAGADVDDYKFIVWLKDIKKETPEWITNYKEDYEILSERFKKHGLCLECKNPNTGEKWCKDCNSKRLEKEFPNWTSKSQEIDKFIQELQLEATEANKFIEWIPYEQFADIEYLAKGGFGEVYKAKWNGGNVLYWDIKNKQWHREKDKSKNYREIVLKSLNDSSTNTDFLQETEKHKIIDDWFNNIVPCYGLSQDSKTGNYLMVMQYMPEGNLRHYLSNKNKELTLKDKIGQLHTISQGLKDIHSKNLVHRDFHSGNILKGIEKTSCLITDLGLCKPVNEISQEEKIFGVMPYVAPEVLRSQPYTQKADIYSFGIIAYEVLSGLPPYYDKKHDEFLGMKICQGLRPQFQIKMPQLLKKLIQKCWDADANKRPTASELERILRAWEKGEVGFKKQLEEAEKYNKTLPEEVKFPKYKIHYGAIYTSRHLPTKEITQLLSQSQEATTTTEYSNSLVMDFGQLNLEQNQEIEQEAKIIHNTLPKNN